MLHIMGLRAKDVRRDEVRRVVLTTVKVVKFGLGMLQPNDMHIKQIAISLEAIDKYGKNILRTCYCLEDFRLILKQINSEFDHRMVPLDESKLSKGHGTIFNFELNYSKYLEKHFIEYYAELRERTVEDLFDYQVPFNLLDKYNHAFMQCKKKLGPIIKHVHVNLARFNRLENVLTEQDLIKFESEHYGVDIRKLMEEP
mmetsp:Transcript_13952/g.21747  ORF Transcript_13952/g.21747 Transcript_13952/m.21747 type:complete len:199 (+) Transcript_13952:3307-3903(+)